MNAVQNVGMAKYGAQLKKYQGSTSGSQTGSTPVNASTTTNNYVVNPNQRIASNVSQQSSPTSSQYYPQQPYYGVNPPSI